MVHCVASNCSSAKQSRAEQSGAEQREQVIPLGRGTGYRRVQEGTAQHGERSSTRNDEPLRSTRLGRRGRALGLDWAGGASWGAS